MDKFVTVMVGNLLSATCISQSRKVDSLLHVTVLKHSSFSHMVPRFALVILMVALGRMFWLLKMARYNCILFCAKRAGSSCLIEMVKQEVY